MHAVTFLPFLCSNTGGAFPFMYRPYPGRLFCCSIHGLKASNTCRSNGEVRNFPRPRSSFMRLARYPAASAEISQIRAISSGS